jgi:hypothetical protein
MEEEDEGKDEEYLDGKEALMEEGDTERDEEYLDEMEE